MNQLSIFQLKFILENKKRSRKRYCKQMLFTKSSHFVESKSFSKISLIIFFFFTFFRGDGGGFLEVLCKNGALYPFKCQTHKTVKHTETIRRLLPTIAKHSSVFDHLWGWHLKVKKFCKIFRKTHVSDFLILQSYPQPY